MYYHNIKQQTYPVTAPPSQIISQHSICSVSLGHAFWSSAFTKTPLYSFHPSLFSLQVQRSSFSFETKMGLNTINLQANIKTEISPFLYIPQTSEKIWHEHAQGMDQETSQGKKIVAYTNQNVDHIVSFILPLLLLSCHHFWRIFFFVGSKELSAACWPVIQCPCHLGDGGALMGCVPVHQLSQTSVLQVVLADPLG